MPIFYYELVKRHHTPGMIQTASIWSCALCGNAISGMGGPGNGELCVPCGEALVAGSLRDKMSVTREALEIVAGWRQCADNLMSNQAVAAAALCHLDKS